MPAVLDGLNFIYSVEKKPRGSRRRGGKENEVRAYVCVCVVCMCVFSLPLSIPLGQPVWNQLLHWPRLITLLAQTLQVLSPTSDSRLFLPLLLSG